MVHSLKMALEPELHILLVGRLLDHWSMLYAKEPRRLIGRISMKAGGAVNVSRYEENNEAKNLNWFYQIFFINYFFDNFYIF
jgi:hypothetical protein